MAAAYHDPLDPASTGLPYDPKWRQHLWIVDFDNFAREASSVEDILQGAVGSFTDHGDHATACDLRLVLVGNKESMHYMGEARSCKTNTQLFLWFRSTVVTMTTGPDFPQGREMLETDLSILWPTLNTFATSKTPLITPQLQRWFGQFGWKMPVILSQFVVAAYLLNQPRLERAISFIEAENTSESADGFIRSMVNTVMTGLSPDSAGHSSERTSYKNKEAVAAGMFERGADNGVLRTNRYRVNTCVDIYGRLLPRMGNIVVVFTTDGHLVRAIRGLVADATGRAPGNTSDDGLRKLKFVTDRTTLDNLEGGSGASFAIMHPVTHVNPWLMPKRA